MEESSTKALAAAQAALSVSAALALIGGVLFSIALPMLHFGVYFSIESRPLPVTATEAQELRYVSTAWLAIGLLGLAIVLAALRRSWGLAVISTILLMCALLLAFVFQVPLDRFAPAPSEPVPANPDYVPCFSGSGDCPGG